jgi:hypothetical protein
VTDPRSVQQFYVALRTLTPPPTPTGILHCPAYLGIMYNLTFFSGRSAVYHAYVTPSDCGGVGIPGGFWVLVAKTLGVPEDAVLAMPRPLGSLAPTPVAPRLTPIPYRAW